MTTILLHSTALGPIFTNWGILKYFLIHLAFRTFVPILTVINNFMFLELPGIKQTAKLVNSRLMDLINGVEDKTDVTEGDEEVINLKKL